MHKIIDSYKLGEIKVEISETKHPARFKVDCNDGEYHSDFTINYIIVSALHLQMNKTDISL